MRDALSETYGVMAYQEDVLKVAEAIAGMSPEDSDGLRKAMSKKRDFVAIERYRRQFTSGACENGCSREVASELWRQIVTQNRASVLSALREFAKVLNSFADGLERQEDQTVLELLKAGKQQRDAMAD